MRINKSALFSQVSLTCCGRTSTTACCTHLEGVVAAVLGHSHVVVALNGERYSAEQLWQNEISFSVPSANRFPLAPPATATMRTRAGQTCRPSAPIEHLKTHGFAREFQIWIENNSSFHSMTLERQKFTPPTWRFFVLIFVDHCNFFRWVLHSLPLSLCLS